MPCDEGQPDGGAPTDRVVRRHTVVQLIAQQSHCQADIDKLVPTQQDALKRAIA
jgi:hypothetical protein